MIRVENLHRHFGGFRAVDGASLEIRHLAPSAVGARVTARAELVKVDGRMLTFRVEAFDEAGKIGEGTHLRAVIDIERFTAKLRARSAAR